MLLHLVFALHLQAFLLLLSTLAVGAAYVEQRLGCGIWRVPAAPAPRRPP
jgi:hypothetical protein